MWIPTGIGELIRVLRGVAPLRSSGGTVNGPAIDRRGFLSGILFLDVGATSGAPSSFTVDAKLQDSPDGTTGWADLAGEAVAQVTAINVQRFKDVNLSRAKAFIRVVVVDAFVGGTSPTVERGAAVVLGGADVLPQG
jgi:hypothetical protein